jgi:uncharacterized protein YhaN
MRITDLQVDGFGVWSGLRIEKFSDSLNVLYGPNEAGKTTLLQFIRSMLYGFSPPRRKYLPPVHGGRPGGMLNVAGLHGRFEIGRYDDSPADGAFGEQVTLTAPDGTRQGEHFIKVLLSNVDEPVFNNVFAIGLREIQELATLSDTEAAEQLYSLSAGLDRVSLVEVLRELANSRNRILDAAGKTCQVVQLLEEREKLFAEIEELGTVNRRWGHLAAEREQIHQEVTRLEEDATRTENLARVLDLAMSLRERWAGRASLDDQLAALGPLKVMPDGAIARLDDINARIVRHQQRIEHLAKVREGAKREFSSLAINDALWRQAARIEAFKEQEPWITQLQGQIRELNDEVGKAEAELAAEREQLGITSDDDALPTLSAKALSPLRSPANLLHQCHVRLEESQEAATAAQQAADSLTQRIESALKTRGERDLAGAMDRAGGLVSQFRRRVQIDERIDQLGRYQAELEERGRHLMDRRILPFGVQIGLGAVFVVGVVLLLAGLLLVLPSVAGPIGWAMAILGLAGSIFAAAGKVLLERSNAQQLEGCQKQLSVLQLQVQQAKEDRDALDAQLPRGGGPISSRLQAAEADLAALEELTPLDTRRNAARQEVEAAQRRAAEAKEAMKDARRRWRNALSTAGLPEGFAVKQVRRLMQRGDRITELQRRMVQRREDLARRQRELESLASRIVQLAADAGVSLGSPNPIEQLRQLSGAAAQQQAGAARREALRNQARRIRIKLAKHEEAIATLKHRRRELFLEVGVKEEQEFRQRALQCARADVLRRDREAVAREIQAALASQCSEEAIRGYLEGPQAVALETRRDELRQRLATAEQQLRERLERRGRLSEQLAALAGDKRLASKHLDLAVLDKRLEDAIRRWQVLAVACCILDMIRTTYEQHRQPETLQEASGYLDQLTQGRYHRVWTPLGEHALRVDDSEGHSLPVEVLSRGTREQLFLSLRLALASSYARRGSPLPLVFDDVLVNFDSDRAKAAAGVLRDFAAAGHQMIVFTCHEHMLKLFKSLKVPVSTLPKNAEPVDVVIALESHVDEPPKRQPETPAPRRKAASKRKPPVAAPEPIESDEEEVEPEVVEPKPKKRPPAPKKHRSSGGTFDADFFDTEDEIEEKAEEDDDTADDDEEDVDESEEKDEADGDEGDEEDDSLWDEEEDEEVEDFDDDDSEAA